jgi:hypothetical protein
MRAPFQFRSRLNVMRKRIFNAAEAVLRGYFRAKDENRPHLLDEVFALDAEVTIRNQSANIEFPAVTHGRPAIADVLVRSFALSYENIYSFYLERPAEGVPEFSCAWLVGMSERSSGNVRVGCGTYDWAFEPDAPHLANWLTINIESMQVLPNSEFSLVFAWLRTLDYPWSSPTFALRGIPQDGLLSPIAKFLGRHAAIA